MTANEAREIAFNLWKKVCAEKDPKRQHELRVEYEAARNQYRQIKDKQSYR